VTVESTNVYIPTGASVIEYVALIHGDGSYPVAMRLAAGATGGTEVQSMDATYTWLGPGTLDVSTLGGWQTIDIQLRYVSGPGTTAFIKKACGRLA